MSTSEPDRDREAETFDLLCALVSSARGALEEGVQTAALRLIHAAGRLADIAAASPESTEDPERRADLDAIVDAVRRDATTAYLESPDAFRAFLDRAVTSMAREVRRSNGL